MAKTLQLAWAMRLKYWWGSRRSSGHYKDDFNICKTCKEPIETKELELHNKENKCIQAKNTNTANRCLLCHKDIYPGERGWYKHLVKDRCLKNKRNNNLFNKNYSSKDNKELNDLSIDGNHNQLKEDKAEKLSENDKKTKASPNEKSNYLKEIKTTKNKWFLKFIYFIKNNNFQKFIVWIS